MRTVLTSTPLRLAGPASGALCLALGLACGGLGSSGADVSHPIPFDQGQFTMQYPGNWTASGPDADGIVEVDAEDCFAMLSADNPPLDPDTLVEAEVDAMGSMFTMPSKSTFSTYGKYTGTGVKLTGSIDDRAGSLRIFSASNGVTSFSVIEHCYDDAEGTVRPGFDLMESTFTLR